MIDATLKSEILGLDKLFELLPEDYTFHDAELENLVWNNAKNELAITYSCLLYRDDRKYLVTFHITPEKNDFVINISPHNPYTYGIDISRSDSSLSKFRFEADGAGPIVNCKNLWIDIKEAAPET